MGTRIVDFSDGYETSAAPDQGVILTGGFGSYSSDAAYIAALTAQGGTLGSGSAYYNTTVGRIRLYTGGAWREFNTEVDPSFFVPVYASDAAYGVALTTAGGTLSEGSMYWNSADDQLKVYDGSAWWWIARSIDGVFKVRSYASDGAFTAALVALGGSLVAGAAYWNSTSGILKVYNGTSWNEVLFASKQQTITNKDYDGGTATAVNRIALPSETLAALTALPRKAGLIYYTPDGGGNIYYDNGTTLLSAFSAAVDSINGYTGAVILYTDDIAEDGSPVNLWFTDLRAQTACISQVITDGVLDKSPSEDAVFDALALKENLSNKGVAGGYAELDGGGKVPIAQLPDTVVGAVDYQGTWDANANSPDLPASSPSKGDYYVVSVAGTTSLGGITDWEIGDWAIYNGSAWEKVDNSEKVTSVNGYTGTVTLVTDDIAEDGSPVNLWFTDARAKTAVVDDAIVDGVTDKAPSQNAVFDALATKQDTGAYITELTGDVAASGPGVVPATIQPGVIYDSHVNAAAALNRTKLAAGTADHVIINDALGVMTSEAQLAVSRGGTGFGTYAKGDLIYSDATNSLAKRAAPTSFNAYGKMLKFVESDTPEWEDFVNPARETRLFEDWIGDAVGALRWLDADSGTGVSNTTTTLNIAGHPGILELATGTTNGGIGARTLIGVNSGALTTGFRAGGGKMKWEWLVRLPTLANATDDYRFDAGLVASTSLTPDQIKIQYNRATSGANWQGICQAASVTTTLDLGVAVAAGVWVKLGIEVNAAGTSVEFFIDGTSCGTIATNIPSASIGPHVRIIKSSVSAVSSLAYVDYFWFYKRFSTAR